MQLQVEILYNKPVLHDVLYSYTAYHCIALYNFHTKEWQTMAGWISTSSAKCQNEAPKMTVWFNEIQPYVNKGMKMLRSHEQRNNTG